MYAKCVEDLLIYKIALELSKEIEELVNKVPQNRKVIEVGQIKRSSSSVPSNISEGFSNRYYPKKLLYYLNIALGSSDESKTHLSALFNKKNISKPEYNEYFRRYKNLSVRILNFINYLRKRHGI